MKIAWDRKVGAAAVIGLVGSLSVLVSIGVAWGSMNGKIDAAAVKADAAKVAAESISRSSEWRDKRINDQSERLGKIETSVQFIVPAIQRIEAKLDNLPTSRH
jgi:hypothetical protein